MDVSDTGEIYIRQQNGPDMPHKATAKVKGDAINMVIIWNVGVYSIQFWMLEYTCKIQFTII